MSNRKTLDYYKSLDYKVVVEKELGDGEAWFIAYANELGKYACYGIGNTQIEALQSFDREKEDFIELLFEKKKPIPEPIVVIDEPLPSGTFSVRTSPEIHYQCVKFAQDQGVSLNQYINTVLAQNSGFNISNLIIGEQLFRIETKLDKHHSFVSDRLNYRIIKPFEASNLKADVTLRYTEEEDFFYGKTG